MMPFELVRKPINPSGSPLESGRFDVPSVASTENELIVNKLDALDEKKGPDKQWANVAKYTAYEDRCFGTPNPPIGRGAYEIDLQKALRRQANGLKHTLRDLEIRGPINNRIASGMTLAFWGADDGKNGGEDATILVSCYPTGSQSLEQFKLSGGKTEDHGAQQSTVHMFAKMASHQ